MEQYKLGKKDPVNKFSIAFSDFVTTYPTAPLVDFAPDYVYPMDLNDQYGDCVVAGFDHSRQIITGLLTGTQQNFTTQEIENFYKTQNPNFPTDDNGMSIQLFLEYLATNKYILGFAKIDHTNEAPMKAAIYLGLSIMTGVQLQQAQQTQFASGTWDYVPNSPVVGGHCINGAGYNTGIYDIVSWGKLIAATDTFVSNQMDEAWFILMQEHIDHPSFRNHFDLAGFANAVNIITDGKVVIPVPVTPTPINNMPTLKLTNPLTRGDAVVKLQSLLNSFGANLMTDGIFGVRTKASVVTFQNAHNLVTDGIVGPKTWAVLLGTPDPKQAMINLIRQVCTDNGVEGDLGVAVAGCESGFNPKITLYNPGSNSTDRGLFQWNNVYHPEITDAMAFDPKESTIAFCNAVKAGKLQNFWLASKNCWKPKLNPDIITKYNIL